MYFCDTFSYHCLPIFVNGNDNLYIGTNMTYFDMCGKQLHLPHSRETTADGCAVRNTQMVDGQELT
jgi:hypothetical protein